MSLHMYCDDYEWVIAASKGDATKVWIEAISGVPVIDKPDEERWQELPPDGMTKMWCDASGKPCEIGEGTLVDMTNREWCEKHGRGYIGTTEQ